MRILTKPATLTLAATLLSPTLLTAGEITLKADKFIQSVELSATAIPTKSFPITVKPEAWGAMKIEKVLPSGSVVKKGDTLVWIDTEDLDEKIIAVEKARVKQKLELANAEQDLAQLEFSTALQLKAAETKYSRFLEDYAYYKTVQRPAQIEEAKFDLFQAVNYLAYSKEELDQLYKMYKADGLTEDTEEIIIKRAKHKMKATELNLKGQEKKTKFTLEVGVPRVDQNWEVAATKAKAELDNVKKRAPRALSIKKQDLEKLRKNDADAAKYLVDLKADRAIIDFKSPSDGIFYYGDIRDGKWDRSHASKVLKIGGDVPSRLTVMTIVPEQTTFTFSATLSEAERTLLGDADKAILRLDRDAWKSYSAQAKVASEYPGVDSKWQMNINFADPASAPKKLILGTKAKVSIIVTEEDDVITVPANAVTTNADGTYAVKVKMAQGDPEMVKVEVGRQSGGQLEITSGLTVGQVVITP